ncbi:tRNA (adenosine(37)-N6)-threonylcarbamoyltransferase complex dimerization subunit type 1 TsaB [Candidatus Saccharibacteria bacterium]|nr:tRNA (adenosine(37)-N6)-threonylcarbamoyltransferase complex dimerization subunit type 1 TsaB [Candidatus Saccharibacteria bacterium]MBI3338203.1 tRNA (adenosine(37)-N6)-threonylcarbamoyltransferase complex dimerization subunit type 1 TsaB [Candidatus Saccharibacteria bacterium]
MIILIIRTDKPEAEIGLYNDKDQLAYEIWQAHRELAETLNRKITNLLQGRTLQEVGGIVVYQGPGSYTGLRIGMSVANALAYSLDCSIAAVSGENWLDKGIQQIMANQGSAIVLPQYDAPARTTTPRK